MINLLQQVLPAIRLVVGNQSFEYRTYLGDALNAMGVSVPRYSSWKTCEGSVQPMDAQNAKLMGLDVAKNGILVWGSIMFNTLDVQDHPDQVRYDGRTYNCDKVTKWGLANGWHSFACTEDKRERPNRATAENPSVEKLEDAGGSGGGIEW